jgi:molybdopterin converting factor small subunit
LSISFYIPGPLRGFTGGQAQVEIQGCPRTLREALALLWSAYPGLQDRVLSEEGKIREHINIFVGTESVRFLEGLATPIPPGTEIHIIPAVSGG